MKKRKNFTAILIFLMLLIPLVRFVPAAAEDAVDSGIVPELKLFSKALGAVMEGYVNAMGSRELLYQAVKGMLGSLDKYSQFIDPEQYKLLKIDMSGEYSGIGAALEIVDGVIAIKD